MILFFIYFIWALIISFCVSLFIYHIVRYDYKRNMRYDKFNKKWERFEFGKWWPEYFRNGIDDELCKEYTKLKRGQK